MSLRRIVPYALLPLGLIACGLASSPWLRAFPSSVIGVPLFGAALLSVLVPLITVGIGVRRLWVTTAIDLVLAVFYELLATLRDPFAFSHLWSGLVHGPSQILTFALPLVSPRELMVAPVALCWLTGALIGECVARGWHSLLPYFSSLVTFGLAYAATVRAVTNAADGRRYDVLLAAGLLVTLLLLRVAQTWIAQDGSADSTQPEGALPIRGLVVGAVLSVAITAVASGVVRTSAFGGHPTTPARTPPVAEGHPLTPVSFVSGLRPDDPRDPGTKLFTMTTDSRSSRYVALATVNYYDGDGWSFDRTFRPSGGVVPVDVDPTMRASGGAVTQTYTIGRGALTTAPWMPYQERPQRVSGIGVNIDPDSGMIVPAHQLSAGAQYTLRSRVPSVTFDQLGRTAQVGTSALANDVGLAGDLEAPLATLVESLVQETNTPSSDAIPFLQAVAREFRTKSALAGGAASSGTASPSRPSPSSSRPSSSPSPSPSNSPHTGGTSFADVLASIRSTHAATPEQYATLMALVARKLLVPVRVVSGFRVTTPGNAGALPAGSYAVTSAQAWTWVEIPIRGQGWVVLDPSPGTYADRQTTPPSGSTPSSTPSSTPAQTAQLTNGNNGNAVAPRSKITDHSSVPGLSTLVVVLIVVCGLIVLVVLSMLLRKFVRRRRRRRRGDPRRRLLAAWQESLDFLAEAGLPEPAAMTSAEIAAATDEQFGPEPADHVRFLGAAANVAIFSPATPVDPRDADEAWHTEAVLTRIVRRWLRWRQRIGARFRYHRYRPPDSRPRARSRVATRGRAAHRR